MSFNRIFSSCVCIVGSLMIAAPSWGQSTVLVNFDGPPTPSVSSFGTDTSHGIEAGPADTGAADLNALRITKPATAEEWAGAIMLGLPAILNDAGAQTVTARVYSTVAVPIVINVEFTEGAPGNAYSAAHGGTGWEDITWSVTALTPTNSYNRFVIRPDFPAPVTGGTYYIDNFSYTKVDVPDPMQPYSQNFDGLGEADPAALSTDGWLAFTNVFDSGGVYKFGFGPDPAPNVAGGSAFSRIVTGQGGASQGTQQLTVFNNYDCCQGPDEGHFNGTDMVEANVYQERILTSADENQTYVVRFDAKKGDIGENTTASWFMKSFIPVPFSQSSFQSLDMTSLPATWGSYCVQLTVPAGTAGQTFQFGYSSTASDFEPSGNYVDNIAFGTPADIGEVDTDNDGVVDCADPDDDNDGILDPYDGPGVNNECTVDVDGDATLDAETISGARTCAAQESVDVKGATTVTGTGNATVIAPLVVLTDVAIESNGQATFINDSCQGAGCPVAAPSGDIAINGGFETGAFNDGSTDASWQQFPNGGTQAIVITNPSEGTYAANLVVPPRGATDPAVDNLIKNANLQAGFLPDGANITITWDMRGSLVGAGGVVFVELFSEKIGGGTNKAEIYTGGPIFPGDQDIWSPYTWSTTIANTAEGGAPGGVTLQLKVSCGPVEGCGADVFFDNVTITLP